MSIICRTRVELTGWSGAPGVNTWYWVTPVSPGVPSTTHVDDIHDEISAYYDGVTSILKPGVTWRIDPVVQYLNDTDGEVQGIVTQTGDVHTFESTATSGNESPAVQVLLRFNTSDYIGGRNVKGRLFIGPLSDSAVSEDGTLRTDVAETLDDLLVAPTSGLGARLIVWHRPSSSSSTNGQYCDVTSALHQEKLAILRSRRD